MSSKSTRVPLNAAVSAFVFTSANAFAFTRYELVHDPINPKLMKNSQFIVGKQE